MLVRLFFCFNNHNVNDIFPVNGSFLSLNGIYVLCL